jgi:hypothetical protein
MANWNQVRYENATIQSGIGNGVDQNKNPYMVQGDKAVYMKNGCGAISPGFQTMEDVYLDSDFSTRLPRQIFATPSSDGGTVDYVNVITETAWYGKSVSTNPFSSTDFTAVAVLTTGGSRPGMAQLKTGTKTYNILMDKINKRYADIGSTALAISSTTCPLTNIVTVYGNRVYCAQNAVLYYSALAKPEDWTTASDAGSIPIGSAKSDITCLVSYNNHVVIFTMTSMHELYGKGPTTYQIVDVSNSIGCVSHFAAAEVNGILYWLGRDGVYSYNGAKITKISDPFINETLDKMIAAGLEQDQYCAGSFAGRFFLSYHTTDNDADVDWIEYDSMRKQWYSIETNFDDLSPAKTLVYLDACSQNANNFYGIGKNGYIYSLWASSTGHGTLYDSLTSESAPIKFEEWGPPYTDNTLSNEKVLKRMYITADVGSKARLTVGYTTEPYNYKNPESIEVHSLGNVLPSRDKAVVEVDMTPQPGTVQYSPILSGFGDVKVFGIQKDYRIKRNGR